ncbi:MAG: ClpXP protease specificity-enhancing factor SspB [Pseudomonadota bacterium]
MPTSSDLDYQAMLAVALRNVICKSLAHVEQHGLTGAHHFYITLNTTHPGVKMPEFLHAKYPHQLKIVLQNRFRQLQVVDEGFSVVLDFADQPAELFIPWDSILSFADPSANFGLRFETGPDDFIEERLPPTVPIRPPHLTTPPKSPNPGNPRSSHLEKDSKVVSIEQFRKTRP